MNSKYEEGLKEVREALEDLGFHPNEIHGYEYEGGGYIYGFSIPTDEHGKFIVEIGSDRLEHQKRFEDVSVYRERLEERGGPKRRKKKERVEREGRTEKMEE